MLQCLPGRWTPVARRVINAAAMLLGVGGGGPEVVDLGRVRALDPARDGPQLDGQRVRPRNHPRPKADVVLTILLIIVVLLLLFGGFGYSRRGRRL